MINSTNGLLLHSKMIGFELNPRNSENSGRKSAQTSASCNCRAAVAGPPHPRFPAESPTPEGILSELLSSLEFAGRCDPPSLGLNWWLRGKQPDCCLKRRTQTIYLGCSLYDLSTADQDFADFWINVRRSSRVLLCPYIYFILSKIYCTI